MWLMTDTGFISIVKYAPRTKANTKVVAGDNLLVRARVKSDIESMFPTAEIETRPGADYLYRAVISRADVATVIAQKVLDLDYNSHAKDVALARSAPAAGRREAYYATWSAMAKMQPYAPYSRYPRGKEPRYTPAAYNPVAGGFGYHYQGPAKNRYADMSDEDLFSHFEGEEPVDSDYEDARWFNDPGAGADLYDDDAGLDLVWSDNDLMEMSEDDRRAERQARHDAHLESRSRGKRHRRVVKSGAKHKKGSK